MNELKQAVESAGSRQITDLIPIPFDVLFVFVNVLNLALYSLCNLAQVPQTQLILALIFELLKSQHHFFECWRFAFFTFILLIVPK